MSAAHDPLPDSWHYLHMTGCPDSLANFIGFLPMEEYRAIRNWMDRALREHERIIRADERERASSNLAEQIAYAESCDG